jgi:hypothetical protein
MIVIDEDSKPTNVSPFLMQRNGWAIVEDSHWYAGYAVNQVKSGICITKFSTEKDADNFITILEDIVTPGGVRVADLPGCELLAVAVWLQGELVKRTKGKCRTAIRRTPVINKAKVIADALNCRVSAQHVDEVGGMDDNKRCTSTARYADR